MHGIRICSMDKLDNKLDAKMGRKNYNRVSFWLYNVRVTLLLGTDSTQWVVTQNNKQREDFCNTLIWRDVILVL